MGRRIFTYEEKSSCGYTFKDQRRRQKILDFPPKPYSKLNSLGEEIILSEEEVKDWTKAYYQAVKELDVKEFSRDEAVYKRIDEILREIGNYRFLQ